MLSFQKKKSKDATNAGDVDVDQEAEEWTDGISRKKIGEIATIPSNNC